MKTIVQCICVSKKQSKGYYAEETLQHEIELAVPTDSKNIYFKLSGGTNLKLNTINQQAADMFVIGETYEIAISTIADMEAMF